jgi:haloalkane dehalogenase
MGQSGKSAGGAYRFADHVKYLDAWFEALDLTSNVTLVLHDWGSALGFHRAARYPNEIKMIAYMEHIVKPMHWEEFGQAEGIFRALRSPEGQQMVLEGNIFVESVLPRGVMRKLSNEEMAAYRKPFPAREDRWPTLVWPRQIPIDGEPADVEAVVKHYATVMSSSPIPKLLIAGDPGAEKQGALPFAGPGQIRRKSQCPASISCKRTLQEIGQALREFVKSASDPSHVPTSSSREADHAA